MHAYVGALHTRANFLIYFVHVYTHTRWVAVHPRAWEISYQRMRDKIELEAEKQGWREELIESVVRQEMQEEAVRLMTGRRGQVKMEGSVNKWHRYCSRQKERRYSLCMHV